MRLRCNCVRDSRGMWRVASAPNPVDTPYTGVACSASASMCTRLAATASSASGEMTTPASVTGDGDDVVESDGANADNDFGLIHDGSGCFRSFGAPPTTTLSMIGTPGR